MKAYPIRQQIALFAGGVPASGRFLVGRNLGGRVCEREQVGCMTFILRLSGLAIRGYPATLDHVIRQLIEVECQAIRDHFINIEQLFNFGDVIEK